MRIVFFCPTEIKEITEILFPSLCEGLSVLSALSAGLLLSHADSFYCPTEIKEIKEILLPHSAKAFLSFLFFLWDIIISCG